MRRRLPSGRKLALLYLLVLAVSHFCKPLRSQTGALAPDQLRPTLGGIQLAYRDLAADQDGAPVLVLLDGSPPSADNWQALLPHLHGRYRLIIPDLPGFGASTTRISDYSIAAQAGRVLQLLDHLGLPDAHFLGEGLGGSVALNLYQLAPGRLSSLALVSADGVQELELLGDYTLNRAVYGAQLFYLWLFYEGTPNFGLFDRARYNLSYAYSYYDTDQRPLRDILLTVDIPTLIVHGEKDLIVPLAAAKEHARLVPHSQTMFIPKAGHRLLRKHSVEIAATFNDFLDGDRRSRKDSTPSRAVASTAPFDYRAYQDDLHGRVIFIVILLALATLVSEDITCITAGLLVSQGAVGFFPACLGCFLGIFTGDTCLYLLGRVLGVRALRIPPLKWFIDAQKIERSKKFFDRYGPTLIIVTRWLPGMRIPTYVAAGMLKLNFIKFISYFFVAASVWTPALVGISTFIGDRLLGWLHSFEQYALLVLVLTIAAVLFVVHLALSLATHRGRRLLRARWQRRLRWKCWPHWLVQLPLIPYILFLALRHRTLSLSNTASKSQLLAGLGALAVRSELIPEKLSPAAKRSRLEAFVTSYPVILKPDTGKDGEGLALVHDAAEAASYLDQTPYDTLAQDFLDGDEISLTYCGHIRSITKKVPTTVSGDGVRTLEFLILDHPVAVLHAERFQASHAARLDEIPAEGETITLSQFGTRRGGCQFVDASELPLEIAPLPPGRYDLRLDRGSYRIIERDAPGAAPTHIFDPRISYPEALRHLRQHWKTWFEHAPKNRNLLLLLRRAYQRLTREHWVPQK